MYRARYVLATFDRTTLNWEIFVNNKFRDLASNLVAE